MPSHNEFNAQDHRETRPWRELASDVERDCPTLWKQLYPRVYEDIGSYHSPREAATYLCSMAAQLQMYGPGGGNSYVLAYTLLEPLVAKQVPCMFIAPKLLDAVRHTTFAEDIDWTKMELPFETAVLMLPKGALVHPVDGECSFIVYGRTRQGRPKVLPGFRPVEVSHDRFAILAMCTGKTVWYDTCLNAKHSSLLKIHNLFNVERDEEIPNLPVRHIFDEPLADGDGRFLDQIGVIVFGTLLALTAKPELLTPAKLLRRIPARKNESAREFWSPNIVGRHYQTKTPKGGTHSSPRMHWRRGHFTNQPYGPEHTLRKILWLEPMLIGG